MQGDSEMAARRSRCWLKYLQLSCRYKLTCEYEIKY